MTWPRSHSKLTESQPESSPPKPAHSGHLFPQREAVRPARVHTVWQSRGRAPLSTAVAMPPCPSSSAPNSRLRAPPQWRCQGQGFYSHRSPSTFQFLRYIKLSPTSGSSSTQFPWLELLAIPGFHDSPFSSQPLALFPDFSILSSEDLPSIGSHHPIEGVILDLLGEGGDC